MSERLLLAPSVRAAVVVLHHFEQVRLPMVGTDGAIVVAEGRELTRRERDVRDAALEFLGSYFRDCETRSAVDLTTLSEASDFEIEWIGGEGDGEAEGG